LTKVRVLVIDFYGDGLSNLSHLQGVRHSIAKEVIFLAGEELRFALKPSEGGRMN
jgi:hypothetical protein